MGFISAGVNVKVSRLCTCEVFFLNLICSWSSWLVEVTRAGSFRS